MSDARLLREAVLRIGEVNGVDGRRIYVLVDKNKNLSDLFFDGDILKNISVNSYIEIRKGFLSIIGRVEGEKIEEEYTDDRSEAKPGTKRDRKSTRLNSSHPSISYAVFCLKKKKKSK